MHTQDTNMKSNKSSNKDFAPKGDLSGNRPPDVVPQMADKDQDRNKSADQSDVRNTERSFRGNGDRVANFQGDSRTQTPANRPVERDAGSPMPKATDKSGLNK